MKRFGFILFLLFFLIFGISFCFQISTQPLFKFGIVADVQYADIPDSGTRNYRKSPEKLAEAVRHFNQAEVSFVMSLGDFINDEMSGFYTLNTITSGLTMPLYHVAGNHDFDPENPDPKQTIRMMNLKNLHYSFSMHRWRFIVLNGNDISLYTNRKGTKGFQKASELLEKLRDTGLPQAQPWNGAIGPKQSRWLKKELELAEKVGEKVILVCHFPIHPENNEGRLWNAPEIEKIISDYPNVFAFLAGHGHVSQHIRIDGIHHLMFRGMVEGSENAYAIISVFDDHIEIEGFGKEVSRLLKN